MTITPSNYDLIIYQGATFSQLFTYKDSAGVVIDLSGYTGAMQVRPSKSSDVVLTTFTTSNGRMSLNASGEIQLTMSATDTADLTTTGGVYDLELTETSSGTVTRLLQGKCEFNAEVTKV